MAAPSQMPAPMAAPSQTAAPIVPYVPPQQMQQLANMIAAQMQQQPQQQQQAQQLLAIQDVEIGHKLLAIQEADGNRTEMLEKIEDHQKEIARLKQDVQLY